MIVTANYSDGTTKVVTNYSYHPTSALNLTDTNIIISYTEGNITKTTNCQITINKLPAIWRPLWKGSLSYTISTKIPVTIPETDFNGIDFGLPTKINGNVEILNNDPKFYR